MCRLSCSVACGIFPDQGSNPCPLHWQADSYPLRHQGSPATVISCLGYIVCLSGLFPWPGPATHLNLFSTLSQQIRFCYQYPSPCLKMSISMLSSNSIPSYPCLEVKIYF